MEKDKDGNFLSTTNPQVLANTLFIFAKDRDEKIDYARIAEEKNLGIEEGKDKMDEDR